MLNPLYHPICFASPRRLTPYSAWHEHIPFAMFLVDILKPSAIVELGSYHGDSYCAFCQAVSELRLSTRCYAVDTWQGDPHSDFFGPEVLANLRTHHDPLYGSFSRLIQSTFDEALQYFEDGTIDLLHIDGYHTYEAVKHDFEAWLPKMSQYGVVLLHDINVRERDFGAWKFWEKIERQHPHFEFLHAHGLGVLSVGRNQSKVFQDLLEASEEDISKIRNFFFELGHRLTLQVQSHVRQQAQVEKENEKLRQKADYISNLEAAIGDKDTCIRNLEAAIGDKDTCIRNLEAAIGDKDTCIRNLKIGIEEKEATLNHIYNSHGWKALLIYYRLRDRILPEGTKRRTAAKRIFRAILSLPSILSTNSKTIPIKDSSKSISRSFTIESAYSQWIQNNEPNEEQLSLQEKESKRLKYSPHLGIVLQLPSSINKEILSATFHSLQKQTYNNWELIILSKIDYEPEMKEVLAYYPGASKRSQIICCKNKNMIHDLNETLKVFKGEFFGFLEYGDTLAPFALYEICRMLNSKTESKEFDIIYTDEDFISEDGLQRLMPSFKPDFSPDTFRSYNYMNNFLLFRKKYFEKIGGFQTRFDKAYIYDLILKAIEKRRKIYHLPKICYHNRYLNSAISPMNNEINSQFKVALEEHLQRMTLEGMVEDGLIPNSFRVRYKIMDNPKISIIIPNRDHADALRGCIHSIIGKSGYSNYEILIIENNSGEDEIFRYYEELKQNERIKVLKYDKSFNYSAINNFAVNYAQGEFLLFMNNDVEVINEEWMDSMQELAARKDVGAVGAKLFYPNGTIQCAGIIIGIKEVAGHLHRHKEKSYNGYLNSLKLTRNVAAVSGACMMVRKEVFNSVGGFDENIQYNFGDVDFCLKLLEKGYRNVFTPFAELVHFEKATRESIEPGGMIAKEKTIFQRKWSHFIQRGDPFFNPNIPLDDEETMEKFFDGLQLQAKPAKPYAKTNFLKNFEDIEDFFGVSVLILNRDKPDLIRRAVECLTRAGTVGNYEIIIGDTGSTDPRTRDYYEQIKDQVRVVFLGSYHFSKNNNELARLAQKRVLLFLNNDVFVGDKFFANLLKYLIFPKVGIVGCRLLFENGNLQHGGIEFVSEGFYKYLGYHPHRNEDGNSSEIRDAKWVPAVTGACLLIEKELFFRAGGFDEAYQAECQDVDLCLKVFRLGYQTLYAGDVEAMHLENATRVKGEENWDDRNKFINRWESHIQENFFSLKRQSLPFAPKILFIRERERGDVLASTAVIREFKKKFLSSHIYFKTKYKELLSHNKFVEGFVNAVNHNEYDCVIDLTYEIGNWEDTFLKTLFRCAGFRRNEIKVEMQYPVFHHISDNKFENELPLNFVVIAPNGGWPQKEWLYQNWVELVKRLKEEMEIPVVQVGGDNDEHVAGAIDFRSIPFNQLGILISRAIFFIGVDSFPMHMALALLPNKKNMIVLTCPTSSEYTFMGEATEIRDDSCGPCRTKIGEGIEVLRCKKQRIKEIPLNKVFELTKKLLGSEDYEIN